MFENVIKDPPPKACITYADHKHQDQKYFGGEVNEQWISSKYQEEVTSFFDF